MHKTRLSVILCFWIMFLIPTAQAQTPTCDKLTGSKRTLASEILTSQHPYDCCDDTIANCLGHQPVCSLAYRLAENVCQRVARNQDKAKIVRGLSRRARSMMPQAKATIDLDGIPMAGSPAAPVTLVEYACARCPYCSKITPTLYQKIVNGPLQGKIKLYFKPFPIRGHEYSKETGLGFIAANTLEHFWEFVLYSYERFTEFCISTQAEWARAVGMDKTAFENAVAEPATRRALVKSKKEGIVNGVDATPTFFINGRKYVGDINPIEIIDVLEEEYEHVKGIGYRQG